MIKPRPARPYLAWSNSSLRQTWDEQPRAQAPGDGCTPVPSLGVPVDAAGRIPVEVRQLDCPLAEEEVISKHDPHERAEENVEAAHDSQEVASAVEERPGLHNEYEDNSEIAPAADRKPTR